MPSLFQCRCTKHRLLTVRKQNAWLLAKGEFGTRDIKIEQVEKFIWVDGKLATENQWRIEIAKFTFQKLSKIIREENVLSVEFLSL